MVKEFIMTKRDDLQEVFQVDNTDQGKMEIEVIRNFFKGTPFKVVLYGRNPDRKGTIESMGERYYVGHQARIALKYATRIAVYIVHKKNGRSIKEFLNDEAIVDKDLKLRNLEWKKHQLEVGIRQLNNIIDDE